MDITCLDTIVGLSQTACLCYGEIPAGHNTSDSGLFIDEVKGFNKDIANYESCQDGGFWDIATAARVRAILTFYSDYNLCISKIPQEQRYQKCTGAFQDSKFSGVITTADAYVGLKIDSCELKGTCFIVRTITFKPSTSGTVDIQIFSNADLTTPVFQALAQAVTANQKLTITANEELNLWDEGCIDLEYFVLVKLNGVIPQKNQIKCIPCSRRKGKCWETFFRQKGVSGDVVTDAENWTETDDANGLILIGEVACNYDELICPSGGLNFKDPYDTMLATAIQYKAAELIYCKALESSNINRQNTIEADEFKERAKFYALRYEEFLNWLCINIPENNNYCLRCNDKRVVKQVAWS